MNRYRIGFIGAGNMGKAIINALVKTGDIPDQDRSKALFVYDIDLNKSQEVCSETGAYKAESIAELVMKSDIIFLCVKPDAISMTLNDMKQFWSAEKLLISVAVGVPLNYYENILGARARIIRTMPNTPALVGEGMTLYCSNGNVSEDEMELVESLLSCLGKAEQLEERLMAEVTALTSSSPAYIYIMIEAMADAAVLSGIKRDMAYRLAAQAVAGAAAMVLETGEHPAKLKDNVCSPAGTTIEAVRVLEAKGFRSAIIEAMEACTEKARLIDSKFRK